MKDQSKTKHVLIQELASLRQRISEFKRLESERKRTEDALRQSNVHYRALADNSLLGVAVMNLDYRIISVNATFATLFRKPAGDFVGKYCFNEFKKRPAVCSHCPGKRAMASGKVAEVETQGKRDDGSLFYVKNRAFPFFGPDGAVNGFIETVEDIVKQKHAEQELRESEEKYHRFFSTSRDCVFLTSRDGSWIDLNEAAVELFGYASREELMQVKIPDLYLKQEDRIKHTSIIAERGYTKEFPVDLRRKDGTVIHTLITSVSLRDKEGNVTGYQGTIRDITERKRAEEKIKESLREKEILLKEIHHRVNNNMQVISSLLNLQSEYVKDKESLEMFKQSRDRIFSMASIHEKLYQSKDMAKIAFDDYTRSISRHLILTNSIDPGAVRLNVNCSDVFLDINKAVPCGLIINELISNAFKHAFPKGRKGEVTIDFHRDGDNKLTLVVGDNGVGLPEDIDISDAKTLGLRLISILVTQLKGTMEVKRDGGTAFTITFTP